VKLAAPLIIAAHAATLPTLDGWADVAVYEGQATRRDDVRQWVTLGYVAGDDGPAVHVEPSTNGQRQNIEAGSIACSLVATAADVAAARGAVFALLEPWTEWLATDRTLDAVLLPDSSLSLVADVALVTTRNGGTATAVVTITYSANTYG
jgi:hypothetical protein